MLTNIVLLGLLTTTPTPRLPAHGTFAVRPRIEVWSNHGDAVYNRGQGVRVYMRADQDAFVTLFRVDTDGRVRVLFPRDPWEDNFVRGGRDFEVLSADNGTAFYVDDYPGVGYLFGVISADPFEYGTIESGDHWDYRAIADGRVRGDPYVALTELAERIVPQDYTDWDYDIVPYHVQQHYDYPRFLCYDCHAYASYRYWDPYWQSCVRFRIVVYDNPYYYPYRYYGTRVVYTRPYRPYPRYVFKDRDGSNNDRFVTREGNRPENDNVRREAPTRRTSTADFIPAPRTRPQSGSVGNSVGSGAGSNVGGEVRRTARGTADGRTEAGDVRREADNTRDGGDDRTEAVRPAPRQSGSGEPRGTRAVTDQTRQTNPRATPLREANPSDSRGSANRADPRSTPQREQSRAEPRGAPHRESRSEPKASPQRESRPESRGSPQRESPRESQPRASEPKSSSRGEGQQPELRRRKPE